MTLADENLCSGVHLVLQHKIPAVVLVMTGSLAVVTLSLPVEWQLESDNVHNTICFILRRLCSFPMPQVLYILYIRLHLPI
jgi:hypothetical protein